MPKALAITRADHTASELREVATRSNDADATRRMLALALECSPAMRGLRKSSRFDRLPCYGGSQSAGQR